MSDLPQKVRGWVCQAVVTVERTIVAEKEAWLCFCAAVEDGNPLYWDDAVARAHTGAAIAPPAMLAAWGNESEWYPGKQGHGIRPLELHFMLKDALGYPHGIVGEVEFEWHRPVVAGDRIRVEQVLREIGDERSTKLGTGRKWWIDVVYRHADGQLAGVQSLRFLAYRRSSGAP